MKIAVADVPLEIAHELWQELALAQVGIRMAQSPVSAMAATTRANISQAAVFFD